MEKKNGKNGKNAVAVLEAKFLPLTQSIKELNEIVVENLGEMSTMSAFDMPRIHIPTGGALQWSVATPDGEESWGAINCIIAAWSYCRALWPRSEDGSIMGELPLCSSNDGRVGHGDPGGDCLACPLAQFGSGADGKRPACKLMARLLCLTEGQLLPYVLTLPPTSIKRFRAYGVILVSAQIPINGVITKLTLEQTKNAQGIKYSLAAFQKLEQLSPEQLLKIREYAKILKPLLSTPVQEKLEDEEVPF